MRSLKTCRLVRGALMALALVLVAAACGGDAADDEEVGIATLADVEEPAEDEFAMGADGIAEDEPESEEPEPAEPEPEEPEEERTIEDASLDFSACMREEGISAWPDPTPGLDGGRPFGDVDFAALGIDPTEQDFLDTVNICRVEFEGVADGREALTPEEEAERRDIEIAMAECIRGNPGWEDFPDPDPNGGGFDHVRDAVLNGEIDFAALVPVLQDCASQLGVELPGGRQGGQGG
ncbi:MAG: hypothetical protein HOH36_12995 [Acidimicrobiaceae bacterium]|jgi:hypothetical protein|nr:hypothetical protein [Acidimicrobiaceae bacterium]MBT5582256.1 hypothetical protein [Acidimicrobiaceae bacterium]MBT5851345.1 hypothetical protein [Acidimicrobiaceae bacterium]